jgi:hypothetical protein
MTLPRSAADVLARHVVFELDNGFAAVDDVAAVQQICDSFGENVIWDLAARWTAILPCPFTPQDTAAGYRYDISVLQAGFSLTQALDKPVPDPPARQVPAHRPGRPQALSAGSCLIGNRREGQRTRSVSF